MDYEFMHAAFPSRMDAGRSLAGKGKGKEKAEVPTSRSLVTGAPQPCEIPCVVSCFSINGSYAHLSFSLGCESPRAAPSDSSSSRGSSPGIDDEGQGVLLEQPALEISRGRDTSVRTSLITLVSLVVTKAGCWTWPP